MYRGDDGYTVYKFLSQFEEVAKTKPPDRMIKLLQNSSTGSLKYWLNGISTDDFDTWNEETKEIEEIFGENDDKKNIGEIMSILNQGLRPGSLENNVCRLFCLRKSTAMSRKEILCYCSRTLLSEYSELLEKCTEWKEVNKTAKEIDKKFIRDKHIKESKRRNHPGQNLQIKSEKKISNGIPSHIKCFNCGDNLYRTSCTSYKQGNLKKEDIKNKEKNGIRLRNLSFPEIIDNRPHVTMKIKEEYYKCLVDSGATHCCISDKLARELKLEISPAKA